MDKLLKQFYTDEQLRDAVHEYLIAFLKDKAIDRVFKGADTKGITDAHEIIEGAFINLKEVYGDSPKPSNSSSR